MRKPISLNKNRKTMKASLGFACNLTLYSRDR